MLQEWQLSSTTPTPTKTSSRARNRQSRATPAASPAPTPTYAQQAAAYAQQVGRIATPGATANAPVPPMTLPLPNPAVAATAAPRAPLPTAPQALITSYASRLRTGATLLMQPILASASASGGITSGRTGTRRGGVINYAEPGSDEEPEREPDAGEREQNSDDSDFIASGGTRGALRASRSRTGPIRTGPSTSSSPCSTTWQTTRGCSPPQTQTRAPGA